MISESERRARRASRRATTRVSRLRVKLTRVGLRNDFGLPISIYAHFMRENCLCQTLVVRCQFRCDEIKGKWEDSHNQPLLR